MQLKKLLFGLLLLASPAFAGTLTLGGIGSGELVIQGITGAVATTDSPTWTGIHNWTNVQKSTFAALNVTTATFRTVSISSNTVMFGATFYANAPILISTPIAFDDASKTGILGTTSANEACTGCYGEYKSSAAVATTNFAATGSYFDMGTVSLTAGDWDISVMVRVNLNGITVAGADITEGIGTAAGNSGTGLQFGINTIDWTPGGLTNTDIISLVIPPFRVQPTGTTTYYHKVQGSYSAGGPPTVLGYRISARRIR